MNKFFVIMHADRLHEGSHNEHPNSEYFRKTELIRSILEQRLLNQAIKTINEGGVSIFFRIKT